MFRFRDALSALVSFGACFALLSGNGCGTDAKAVEECRDIEEARCEAGKACGIVEDVDACKRFYRDHCLHGMVVESPGKSTVETCVNTIEAAGVCAQTNPELTLADCPNTVSTGTSAVIKACDVVIHPEITTECGFLATEPPSAATGGTGSTADPDAGDSYANVDSGTAGEAGSPAAAGAGGALAQE